MPRIFKHLPPSELALTRTRVGPLSVMEIVPSGYLRLDRLIGPADTGGNRTRVGHEDVKST